jgi:hypothetical protein
MATADVIGGPAPREALLARTLVELADTLVADFDVVELMTRLTDRCVEVLGVGAAGLMLAGPDGELKVMASSSEAMRVLELFELQAKEGPCLDSYRSGKPVMQADLATPTSPFSLLRPSPPASAPSTPCPCGCGARSSAPSTCSTSRLQKCAQPTSQPPKP